MNTVKSALTSPPASALQSPHRIVIVGGGAGGLELATQLGNRFANKTSPEAHIVLADREATHVWKPLLHEVAAGSLDAGGSQVEYIAHAHQHHFEFQQGELIGVDHTLRRITLAQVCDEEGVEVLPQRDIAYDTLILAVGSVTNFFGVPGAQQYTIALDSVRQAEHFRKRLISACMRTQSQMAADGGISSPTINIVIIGGGATGVELSAELRNAAEVLNAYGLYRLDPVRHIRITVVDSGPRILAPLPQEIADRTGQLLHNLHIDVLTGEKVVEIQEHAVLTASGKQLDADITVWAAGIQIAKIVAQLGLATNRMGQLLVNQSLQSESDPNIFAIGDCAACPWLDEHSVKPQAATPAVAATQTLMRTVPPLAQAAHQQASCMVEIIRERLAGKPLPLFQYRDHGSLVSLGAHNAIGQVHGSRNQYSIKVSGLFARLLYLSVYRLHVMALHGFARMLLDTFSQWLRDKTGPRVKLH